MEPRSRAFFPGRILGLAVIFGGVVGGCASGPTSSSADWIARSNAVAEEYLLERGRHSPEEASQAGDRRFDDRGFSVSEDFDERETRFFSDWSSRIARKLPETPMTDTELRVDLQILKDHLDLRILSAQASETAHALPFWPVTRQVYEFLRTLVNPQSGADRKSAAVSRFHSYVRGEHGGRPFTEGARLYTLGKLKRFGRDAFFPLKPEIERYLTDTSSYIDGIRGLLEQSGNERWKADFAAFRKQAAGYDRFLRERLLPRARTSPRLPAALYAQLFRDHGIDIAPSALAAAARAEFTPTLALYGEVARQVATAHGWTDLRSAPPAQVLRRLKRDQVLRPEAARQLYASAEQTLEKIVRAQDLVTLPEAPLKIRMAGDAESRASPTPHLVPPPLIYNRGERPEFVVPTASNGKLPFDDFSFEAAALALTAHEGRPGHDLQFSTMLDRGVSIIRGQFAFNNVNVEGWGLYAERMVYDYLPLDAKLVSLQVRLLRIARAFLDPGLQSGEVTPAQVRRLLTEDVGISPEFAELELRRYLYEDPGQAPAYFYGLRLIEKARALAEAHLGSSFRPRCFNDAVLSYGLLPLQTLSSRLAIELDCAHLSDAGAGY